MTELREKINNLVEDHQECLILAKSVETLDVYTDTTATPEDIREGKVAYSNGERIVGTMKSNSGLTLSPTEPTGEDRKSTWLKSSKNLLDTSKFPQKTSYGITTTVDEDGTITLNGKSNSTNNHIVMRYKLPQELLNEWVTFGFESTEDLNTAATQIYPGLKNSSKGNLTSAWILYEGVSRIREIQVTQDMIDNSYYFGVYIANGITLNNSKLKVMLTVGKHRIADPLSMDIPYEKYITPEVFVLDENDIYQNPSYFINNIYDYM